MPEIDHMSNANHTEIKQSQTNTIQTCKKAIQTTNENHTDIKEIIQEPDTTRKRISYIYQ